jgi:hypothetical protein
MHVQFIVEKTFIDFKVFSHESRDKESIIHKAVNVTEYFLLCFITAVHQEIRFSRNKLKVQFKVSSERDGAILYTCTIELVSDGMNLLSILLFVEYCVTVLTTRVV